MIFTLKDLTLDAEKATITGNTVYILLGKDIVVTLSKKQMFTKIEARLGDANDRIRTLDSSYLVYIMMDYMIDNYFKTVERVNETIEKLQQRVTSQPGRKNVTDINLNRRKVLFIQKNIQPLIRVMNGLQREIAYRSYLTSLPQGLGYLKTRFSSFWMRSSRRKNF